jgi:hypothetical protein
MNLKILFTGKIPVTAVECILGFSFKNPALWGSCAIFHNLKSGFTAAQRDCCAHFSRQMRLSPVLPVKPGLF